MKIIITGGRDYRSAEKIAEVLYILKPTLIIHGDATGADALAKEWALHNKIDQIAYPAKWSDYGLRAGPIRNMQMINDFPDAIVVAFKGGAGTANCVSTAVHKERIVFEVR